MRRSSHTTNTRAAVLAACLSGAAGSAWAIPTLSHEPRQYNYTGNHVQDFVVPGYLGTTWRFTVEGADGGDAERRRGGNREEIHLGGEGATLRFEARIGYSHGELRPGATLRFIVGEEGFFGWTTSVQSPGRLNRSGGGGGGGSALLYLRPGEHDWNNAEMLAVAGGGGGAFVIGGSNSFDSNGGNAQLGPTGGNPTGNCSDGTYRGGVNGYGSAYTAGGRGAYALGGEAALAIHGFPDGAHGVDTASQWGENGFSYGFGAGDAGVYDYISVQTGDSRYVGGGGGFSGGAGWNCFEYYLLDNFNCRGGGGGGGSYLGDAYTIPGTGSSTVGNSGAGGLGKSEPVSLQISNDGPSDPAFVAAGVPFVATFAAANPSGLSFCGAHVADRDLWYVYTNQSICDLAVTITSESWTTAGAPLGDDAVDIRAYPGAAPTGAECGVADQGGVLRDVVASGESVAIRVSSADPDVTSFLTIETEVAPRTPSAADPTPVELGVRIDEWFCGAPFGPVDTSVCATEFTTGREAFYEYVNAEMCPLLVTFNAVGPVFPGFAVIDWEGDCAMPAGDGTMTRTLGPGERMLLQIISLFGEGDAFSFRVDAEFEQGQPDCDGDGVPDACDLDGPCGPPVNDDMPDAVVVAIGDVSYDTSYATLDGAASCDNAGGTADVWYLYTASEDGQLAVSAYADAGEAATGQVGVSLFTPDGLTELDCDLGAEADRVPGLDRNTFAFAPMRAGETVLIRLTTPDGPGDPLASGSLWIELDTSFTNDDCEDAIELTLGAGGSTIVPFPLAYAQNEGPEIDCSTSSFGWFDAWFTFTAPSGGTASFLAMRNGGAGAVIGAFEFYDACGGSLLGCGLASFVGEAELPMTAGQTVSVRALRPGNFLNPADPVLRLTFAGNPACGSADLNTDGLLDLSDINLFTSGFLARDPIADLDGSGVFDLTDINLFTSAFVAGCP